MADRSYSTAEVGCIISCRMQHPEIAPPRVTGFLNPRRILFTPPGLHVLPEKLEEHLLRRLAEARDSCPDHKTNVVYGRKCHVSTDEPLKRVDAMLQEAGREIARVQGDYGYDMLADSEERGRISGGRQDKILWFTPAGSRAGRQSTRAISAGMRQMLMPTSRGSTTRSSSWMVSGLQRSI
jgi:hypothetical protein